MRGREARRQSTCSALAEGVIDLDLFLAFWGVGVGVGGCQHPVIKSAKGRVVDLNLQLHVNKKQSLSRVSPREAF